MLLKRVKIQINKKVIFKKKEKKFYGIKRAIVLGKAIASLMESSPQIHITNLETPMPNPEWGTEP